MKNNNLFNHKISLSQILAYIPHDKLTLLASESKVDYCAKVLSGKLVFYLLIYGLLKVDRLSQRGLSEAFSSALFRCIFNYQGRQTLSHSAISQRFASINVDFFEQAYYSIYDYFSSLYTKKEIAGYYLERVDSSLVKDVSGKLRQGLVCGNEHSKRKMIKFTLNYDGMFGSCCRAHTQAKYSSETNALAENIYNHLSKSQGRPSIYLIDKGQGSAEVFKTMASKPGLYFIGRLQDNRKMKIVKELPTDNDTFTSGTLLKDRIVQLYKTVKEIGKNGKVINKSYLVEERFRVVTFLPQGADKPIHLITNLEELTASQLADTYKRRWDIEVFFRFLKQQLNFSHFLSLNENGIGVVLYMTLITAMLVMIYKKENEIGYKTAIRRMGIELEHLVLGMVVIQSGGDIKKTNLHYP